MRIFDIPLCYREGGCSHCICPQNNWDARRKKTEKGSEQRLRANVHYESTDRQKATVLQMYEPNFNRVPRAMKTGKKEI